MRIDVITIFPEYFEGPLTVSLLGKAQESGLVEVHVHNLRDWTEDVHRTVDRSPYGGGAGMVMSADPWFRAAEDVWGTDAPEGAGGPRPRTAVMTPRGKPFTQALATEFANLDRLVLLCGRYEGIDERVHEAVATDEISIGDYVLAGGEVAASVVIEAVTRLVPGVMGNDMSGEDESFSEGLLEYPQYTRPADYRGMTVPDVLTSGNHAAVDAWRLEQAESKTKEVRPDLWEAYTERAAREAES